MNAFHYTLLILITLLLINCDRNTELVEEIDNKIINVSVSYVKGYSNKDTIPDVGAKLYVFHDISITEVTSYTYIKGEGVLVREDVPKISFDEVHLIPHTGEISISLHRNMNKVLIAVESNYFKKDKRIVWLSENQLKYLTQTRIHKVFFIS